MNVHARVTTSSPCRLKCVGVVHEAESEADVGTVRLLSRVQQLKARVKVASLIVPTSACKSNGTALGSTPLSTSGRSTCATVTSAGPS